MFKQGLHSLAKRPVVLKPKKLILTAGPSISKKEISYVLDAVKNGWNEHYNDYVEKLEARIAAYVGCKYALATSGGTGALHLALAALGVGPGDEVILPDITFYACSDVVMLLGAKPVFVDVLADTWCIAPSAIEKAITKKTKAIMPVHIYGNLCDMREILAISKKNKIPIVEDACPALGSVYHGKKPGSFGEFGAFSFQGAKITVTGIGGMLVTSNADLFKKVKYLNRHGEDSNKKFWQTSVGYKYSMSNLQAALGLAQVERNEGFVAKKRQILKWYKAKLGKIPGITMNLERSETKSNFWMSSIILGPEIKRDRDEVRRLLKEKLIDSRPFFYPISMFPMYKEQNTPVAHHVGLRGINLPSGLNLRKEEVDYISQTILDILN